MLLDACGRLARQGVRVQLELMGQFQSPEFERCVRQRVAELGIDAQVTFLGVRVGREKWRAYQRADVFCLPTFFESETLPLVILEAMAFGLPAVATAWRGIPSIIDDGQTGLLVATHDERAVAEALARLANDPTLRRRMGEASRQKFDRQYSVQRHLERMDDVFAQIAEGLARPRAATAAGLLPEPASLTGDGR